MNRMEVSRRTWSAAVNLAAVLSLVAAIIAIGLTQLADVPQVAIVLPVIVIAFVASWIQTGRVRQKAIDEMVIVPARRVTTTV